MIKFVLILTKQGQTRLSHYYEPVELADRPTLEADVIRRILARPPGQVGIMCDIRALAEGEAPTTHVRPLNSMTNFSELWRGDFFTFSLFISFPHFIILNLAWSVLEYSF